MNNLGVFIMRGERRTGRMRWLSLRSVRWLWRSHKWLQVYMSTRFYCD